MNMQHNLAEQIASAEMAGDMALLASIARQLLNASKPRAKKPVDSELLTYSERKALGLPPAKVRFKASAPYQWASVAFGNGHRILVGFYPRAGESPETTAKRAARSRYLLTLSGGRYIDPDKALGIPMLGAVDLAPDVECERHQCAIMRKTLESDVRLAALRERAANWTK